MAPSTVRMSMDEKRKVILQIYHKTKSVYMEKEIITLASKAGVNAQTIVDINQSLIDDGLVDKEKIGGTNYFWSFPAKKDRLMEIQYHKTLEEIIQLQKVLDETNVRLMDAKRGREEEDDEDEANEDEVEEVKVTNTTTITDEGIDENKNPEDDVVDPVKNKVENDTNDTENDRTDNGSNVMDQTIKSMMKNEKKNKKMKRHEKLIMLQQIQNEKLQIQKDINSLKEYDPVVIANYEKEYDYVMKAANRWTDNIFNCKSYLMKKRNVDKKDANRILGINDTFDYPEEKK